MKDSLIPEYKIKNLLFLLLFYPFFSCTDSTQVNTYVISVKPPAEKKNNAIHEEIAVSPPPFSDGIYPCSDCHKEQKPNPVRRKLVDFHQEISEMFNHDSQNRWCLDCHDLNNRDSLRLASGRLLDFRESYKLCGQCHGDKLRDWKAGVHGRRTGEWNGKKQYFLCVSCHNPHSPRFKQIKPEPPPFRQEESLK